MHKMLIFIETPTNSNIFEFLKSTLFFKYLRLNILDVFLSIIYNVE